MTNYSKSIDKTEPGMGLKFSATVGSGGVTAGRCVKWDGTNNNTIVQCSAVDDNVIGIARDTVSENGYVTVLSDGCLVATGETLTVGGLVGCAATTGKVADYASDTYVGSVVKSTGWIRVKIQY